MTSASTNAATSTLNKVHFDDNVTRQREKMLAAAVEQKNRSKKVGLKRRPKSAPGNIQLVHFNLSHE